MTVCLDFTSLSISCLHPKDIFFNKTFLSRSGQMRTCGGTSLSMATCRISGFLPRLSGSQISSCTTGTPAPSCPINQDPMHHYHLKWRSPFANSFAATPTTQRIIIELLVVNSCAICLSFGVLKQRLKQNPCTEHQKCRTSSNQPRWWSSAGQTMIITT